MVCQLPNSLSKGAAWYRIKQRSCFSSSFTGKTTTKYLHTRTCTEQRRR